MTPDPFIKVCGITRLSDALHASEWGATALGFVFWPRSPRHISPDRAAEIISSLPRTVKAVGVFVDEPVDSIRRVVAHTGISLIQLHGEESPDAAEMLGWPVLRAITVDRAAQDCAAWPRHTTFLVDAIDGDRRGGTGDTVEWRRAASVAQEWRVVLAGGLTPANVAEAIGVVRPFGVDVSSGVEDAPGVKNADKVTRFLANARAALQT